MAIFTVNKDKTLVKADTSKSAYQLFNEGIVHRDDIPDWPVKPDTWYKIRGSYGLWVLENEFPNFKCDEYIDVKYED